MKEQTRTDAREVRTTRTSPMRTDENGPFENFEALATKLLGVPKEEVDEKRAEQEKARKQKQG